MPELQREFNFETGFSRCRACRWAVFAVPALRWVLLPLLKVEALAVLLVKVVRVVLATARLLGVSLAMGSWVLRVLLATGWGVVRVRVRVRVPLV